MPIYDTSYRHIEGVRKAKALRFPPIAEAGIRLFFRKKRYLLLTLVGFVPFVFYLVLICAPHYAPEIVQQGSFPPQLAENFHVNPQGVYIYLTQGVKFLILALTALVGAGLIANDLRANALEIYFSRSITLVDYLVGKLLVPMAILLGITLLPLTLLWLLDVSLATEEGFFRHQLPLMLRIVVASLALALPYALLVLALSSLSRSARGAMIVFGALLLLTLPIGEALADALNEPRWELIKIDSLVRRVVYEALDTGSVAIQIPVLADRPMASLPTWEPLVALGVLMALCVAILLRRVRGVEIVKG